MKEEKTTAAPSPQRASSSQATDPMAVDSGSPSLLSFFVIEFLKWGSLLFVTFIVWRFAEPLWGPIYDMMFATEPPK